MRIEIPKRRAARVLPSAVPPFIKAPLAVSEMRMSKETWAALNGDHNLTIVRANWDGATGDVIAVVWAEDGGDEVANARLFATAPKLYEALANFTEGRDIAYTEALVIARAVLAEARGQ